MKTNRLLQQGFAGLLCLVTVLLLFSSCGGVSPAEGLTPKSLTWGVGGVLPTAEEFFSALPAECTARFAEAYSYQRLGTYKIEILVEDERGRCASYEVQLTLVLDEQPPVMTGVQDLSISLGESVAYRQNVQLSDNCDGEVTLSVDTSAVNLDAVGAYPVIYTARDAAGNVTSKAVKLYIYERTVSQEELFAEIDAVLATIVTPSMNREQQARAVHRYVFDHIGYSSTSDKSDWVREAHNALFVTGRGDCFSYFAACKAFLTRLGIEHMDIQRTPGIVEETHFWHLINIGTSDAPLWYHFDATHLQDYAYSGCLLTDAQIADYNAERYASDGMTNNYFYAYDASAYPKSAAQIITAQ